jgi:hypothetical protein
MRLREAEKKPVGEGSKSPPRKFVPSTGVAGRRLSMAEVKNLAAKRRKSQLMSLPGGMEGITNHHAVRYQLLRSYSTYRNHSFIIIIIVIIIIIFDYY